MRTINLTGDVHKILNTKGGSEAIAYLATWGTSNNQVEDTTADIHIGDHTLESYGNMAMGAWYRDKYSSYFYLTAIYDQDKGEWGFNS